MRTIIAVLVLVLTMINISFADEYGDDYWMQCEDNKKIEDLMKENSDLDLNLLIEWKLVSEQCANNCLYYKAWLVNGILCIEYKRVNGITT